jgi:hypothetical protein
MPDVREYSSVMAEAEAAAKRGDFTTAERLLRLALPQQEAALGPAHPDVASSLNNLAVLCESSGRLDEAERLFRRAYAIALGATGHANAAAILATSRDNLADFCTEHGRVFDSAALLAPAASTPATPAASGAAAAAVAGATSTAGPRSTHVPAPPRTPAPRPHTGPTASSPSTRRWHVPAVTVIVVGVLAAGLAWRSTRSHPSDATSPPVTVADTPRVATVPVTPEPTTAARPAQTAGSASATPAATEPPVPPAPAAPPVNPATAAGGAPSAPPAATTAPPVPRVPPTTDAAAVARDTTPTTATGLTVVSADLCASLETRGRTWTCAPPDAPSAPGRLSFVTRVASPRAVRLRHRWSQDGAVRQTVALSAGASPVEGYRTFSRQSVTRGAWTVELLDADGAVLVTRRVEVR